MSHIRIIKMDPFISGEPNQRNQRTFIVTYEREGRPPSFVQIPAAKILKPTTDGKDVLDMPALEREIVARAAAMDAVEGHTFQV